MTIIRHALATCLAFASLLATPAHPADAESDIPAQNVETIDVQYRQAIETARAGNTENSLDTLQSLVVRLPQRQDILGDYVVVLGWAGNHAAALGFLDRVDHARAPAYVLESLANSARRLQRYDLAVSLYLEAETRFPERTEPQVGRALALADSGKTAEADAILERLRTTHPQRIDVLEAVAYVAVAKPDHIGALAAWQAILARDPANRTALRGRIQALDHLGAPQLAATLADRYPGLLSRDERDAVSANRTAHQIRWGTVAADTGRGASRFADIDLALADSDAAGNRAMDIGTSLTATERQLAIDRIGALHARYRMHDAIALYDALAARPEAMPAYAQSAAASAQLYLEHPEKARDLYRQALATDPDNVDARIGLFYALTESEEHDAALAEIALAVASTPPTIAAWSPATTIENPAYARVLAARAMAPLSANRPGESWQRLNELSARAPFNMDIRTDHASAMRARGWPRAAAEELQWVLAADPDNSGALGEHAGALLEMRDYRKADSALAQAQATMAEDGRVVRAARLSRVHNMAELIIDGTFGRSSDGPTGSQNHALEAWLYSRPLDDNYRAFAHLYSAEAKFANGTGQRKRSGAGLEYRSPLITATGELSHDADDGKTGAAASLAFTPDDHWTLGGSADTSSNETPLQARLAGIDARSRSGEVTWRAHESRSAALSFGQMNFSDGNRRDSTQARWTERMISGPVYQLEITGSLYASHNSAVGAAYFNPSRDFSPSVEFANEWLQWRRYTRLFTHRLVVSAGTYSQSGFATGPAYGARYEQEWESDDRLTFRYGIGRSLHPYDGAHTARNYAYFSLNWKF